MQGTKEDAPDDFFCIRQDRLLIEGTSSQPPYWRDNHIHDRFSTQFQGLPHIITH